VAELTGLAAQGEGANLEYKEKLPDTKPEKRTVFKTVVAFANGDGGIVLFGVRDDGEIKRLDGDLAEQRRRLVDLIRSLITPAPRVRVRQQELDGRAVLIAEVPPGDATLHALVPDANKPEYYVRRDGTTYYATPDEVTAIVGRPTCLPVPRSV
jgi:ATP-dependent DNA helicase RecG